MSFKVGDAVIYRGAIFQVVTHADWRAYWMSKSYTFSDNSDGCDVYIKSSSGSISAHGKGMGLRKLTKLERALK